MIHLCLLFFVVFLTTSRGSLHAFVFSKFSKYSSIFQLLNSIFISFSFFVPIQFLFHLSVKKSERVDENDRIIRTHNSRKDGRIAAMGTIVCFFFFNIYRSKVKFENEENLCHYVPSVKTLTCQFNIRSYVRFLVLLNLLSFPKHTKACIEGF